MSQPASSSAGPSPCSKLREIFFSIVYCQLTDNLLTNQYIDSSVQRGDARDLSGMVMQLIREAQEGKGGLAVIWLDQADAHDLIPHKFVEAALEQHHVRLKLSRATSRTSSWIIMRLTLGTITSEQHWLEKGLITGCTISMTLFALAMNMLVKSAEAEYRGPKTKSRLRSPPSELLWTI